MAKQITLEIACKLSSQILHTYHAYINVPLTSTILYHFFFFTLTLPGRHKFSVEQKPLDFSFSHSFHLIRMNLMC